LTESQDRTAKLLEDLRDRLQRLPVYEIQWDGAPLKGVPQALERAKVLAMVEGSLRHAREPQGRIGEVPSGT
jgi:hypothetical protein